MNGTVHSRQLPQSISSQGMLKSSRPVSPQERALLRSPLRLSAVLTLSSWKRESSHFRSSVLVPRPEDGFSMVSGLPISAGWVHLRFRSVQGRLVLCAPLPLPVICVLMAPGSAGPLAVLSLSSYPFTDGVADSHGRGKRGPGRETALRIRRPPRVLRFQAGAPVRLSGLRAARDFVLPGTIALFQRVVRVYAICFSICIL